MHDETVRPVAPALEPLDIEEVRERLEISPLAAGADVLMRDVPSCVCKNRYPDHDDDDGDWYYDPLGGTRG